MKVKLLILLTLICAGHTLAFNDEQADKAAKTCSNEVYAIDNPKQCEK